MGNFFYRAYDLLTSLFPNMDKMKVLENGKVMEDDSYSQRKLSCSTSVQTFPMGTKRSFQDEAGDEGASPMKLKNHFQCSEVYAEAERHLNVSLESTQYLTCTDEEQTVDDPVEDINGLPQSILTSIFSQLSLADRQMRLALVCRYWHQLTQDPDLWREVNLRGFLKVDDAVLLRVVQYSKRVTSIDATDCRGVTDVGMEGALNVCTDLIKLTLARCQQLTERTFVCIAHNVHLRELNLSCCFHLDDASLSMIAAGCPSLVELQVNQCSLITDLGICDLARSCHDLQRLYLEQNTKVTDVCLCALVAGCPRLSLLNCKGCQFSADGVVLLSQLHGLTHLDISSILSVNDEVVVALVRGCPLLDSLNLSLCEKVTDKAVEHLAKFSRRIQSLYLVSCNISDEALRFLADHCNVLQTLDVAWCSAITNEGAEFLSVRCPCLRYLGLMRCDQISPDASETLSRNYQHIHFSTMWLDCKRVFEKARMQGFNVTDEKFFYENHKAAIDATSL